MANWSVSPLPVRILPLILALASLAATAHGQLAMSSTNSGRLTPVFLEDVEEGDNDVGVASSIPETFRRFLYYGRWYRPQSSSPESKRCRDASPMCARWGTDYCAPQWHVRMNGGYKQIGRDFCPKTCGKCGTSPSSVPKPKPRPQNNDPKPPTPASTGTPKPKPKPNPTPTDDNPPPTDDNPPTSGNPPAGYMAAVLACTNRIRKEAGKPELCLNRKLNAACMAHSQDMKQNNYFDHTSRNGRSPGDRMKAAGLTMMGWGENIAMGYSSPEAVCEGWRKSPGHYSNMIGNYNLMGIANYQNYWTQGFANSDEPCDY